MYIELNMYFVELSWYFYTNYIVRTQLNKCCILLVLYSNNNLHQICIQFLIKIIGVGTVLSNGDIWGKFSEQHQHEGIKSMPNLHFLSAENICIFLLGL